jgi:hypothetical protein
MVWERKVMEEASRMVGGYFYVDRGGNGNGNVVAVRRLPCFWNVGCRVSMLDILMMMIGGGDGPSRMAGHAMIDEPMYLGGNPTR